jgi:hypothetical protein
MGFYGTAYNFVVMLLYFYLGRSLQRPAAVGLGEKLAAASRSWSWGGACRCFRAQHLMHLCTNCPGARTHPRHLGTNCSRAHTPRASRHKLFRGPHTPHASLHKLFRGPHTPASLHKLFRGPHNPALSAQTVSRERLRLLRLRLLRLQLLRPADTPAHRVWV